MKIGIQTWGSDGDIHPFIALAGGLAAAGHQVTLAVTSAERKDYGQYAARLGFRLVTAGYIGKDEQDLVRLARRMHAESHPLRQLDIILEEMFEPGAAVMYETARTLAANNDCVIGHFIVHPAQAAAEKAGKPYISVALNHSAIPSRYIPLMGTPDLGPWLNGLVWKLGIKVLNGHILPHINRLRRQEGLAAVPSFRDVWESRLANLIAVSPSFCPRPTDWAAHQHVCGFFTMQDEARPWDMPEDLRRFIDAGPPPVYITFGSMMSVDTDPAYVSETTGILADGAKKAGCRAIIQSSWPTVTGVPEHDALYRITAAPHTRVFPECAAVVHHGGAGTTQTATLCGCPSVVVAHISDQYFWARELKRLGIAPAMIDRRKLTAEKLAKAIRAVLDTPSMNASARKLGEALRGEDGVRHAVDVIEKAVPVARS